VHRADFVVWSAMAKKQFFAEDEVPIFENKQTIY